jgi:hypothetical protein
LWEGKALGSEKGKGLDCEIYSEQGEREKKNGRRVDESEKSW